VVILDCIDEMQSAFVNGRHCRGAPNHKRTLLMGELKGKRLLLFKANFDKAFDSLNWNYLDSVIEQMNY